MPKLYLITGFLGSGKTTFLKKLILHLSNSRLCVIVNEFGREGIDGSLLSETGAAVNEINNGSIFCTCRMGMFSSTLETAVDANVDYILIETSGLSDPTSIQALLGNNDKLRHIQYCGSICIVDALRFEKIFSIVNVCKNQITISNLVLINKSDLANADLLARVHAIVKAENPNALCFETKYGDFDPEWLDEMSIQVWDGVNRIQHKDSTLRKALITMKDTITLQQLNTILKEVVRDTFRIKGFVKVSGMHYFVDCVGPSISVTKYDGKVKAVGKLVALAGSGMPIRSSLKAAIGQYPDCIESIE